MKRIERRSQGLRDSVVVPVVVVGIAVAAVGCGGFGLGGFGIGGGGGGPCAALATEAGEIAQQAFADPANADFCRVAELNLEAFDAGCFGNAVQFVLPPGINAADFRAQLAASAEASCQ